VRPTGKLALDLTQEQDALVIMNHQSLQGSSMGSGVIATQWRHVWAPVGKKLIHVAWRAMGNGTLCQLGGLTMFVVMTIARFAVSKMAPHLFQIMDLTAVMES
jgi:hypothetical protein